jgi:hypothetical protein
VHEFAVFQEVSGKILPAYAEPVWLDLREVFSYGGCEAMLTGRVSCTRVIMNDGSVYALDIPVDTFKALKDAVG